MTFLPDHFEFVFHRAHNGSMPENSPDGIREIISLGAGSRIEVDVCTTSDRVAVAHHDLDLNNSCGNANLVSEYEFAKLPPRLDGQNFVTIEEIMNKFPEQAFLFDLRTENHGSYFGGEETGNRPAADLVTDMIEALTPVLTLENKGRIRLLASTIEQRSEIADAFREYDVDVAELGTRTICEATDPGMLEFGARRIYSRYRKIDRVLVDRCHGAGLRIYATGPAQNTVEHSLQMLQECAELGVDGLVARPVNDLFINTLMQKAN